MIIINESYKIDTLTPSMEPGLSLRPKTPEEAFRTWVRLSVKDPTAVNLTCTKKSAEDLVDWLKSNLDRVEKIFFEEGADKVFNIPKMMDTIKRTKASLDYGDEYYVHPFTYG